MTTPALRYPTGEVTPHGWWHIVNGTRPWMRLRAYDKSIEFYMMGGLAPPFNDPMEPEGVAIKGLKGLIPPWEHIDQKGATEDGITQVDALYGPTEVEAVVECIGRDGRQCRKVRRHLIDSIDAKQTSELSFLDLDNGYWWANVRWFKGAPPDPMAKLQSTRQQMTLRLRADNAFWRSYADTAEFSFTYDSTTEEFGTDHATNLGTNWPQRYTGAGGGLCIAQGGQAIWAESGTDEREVVNGPLKDFDTDTDNQVIEMQLGSMPEITFLGGTFNDIWGRMGHNPDGSWDGNGIRARIGLEGFLGWIQLSRFNDFTETIMYGRLLFIPPLFAEKFTLVCGVPGDPRMFRIMRGGLTVLSHKEAGEGSELGEDFRGIGFGMYAGESLLLGQRSPAWVQRLAAGDNATVSQSGFLKCTNIGDQPLYYEHTFFGPGTCRIWDGPGAQDYVEFGPLLPNQVVWLGTDPRGQLLQDLTSIPPTPQELNVFQTALQAFESFAFANNIPPLLQGINSFFGIKAPQGNLFKYLKGRFSDASAIPAKSPGNDAQPYYVKCEIVDGSAESKIISSGVPLRRYPV